MYITKLSLRNLRCFQKAELEFLCPDATADAGVIPNINLLLGDNGSGKTSVLRACTLAALAPVLESSGLVPYRLVRRTQTQQPLQAQIDIAMLLHPDDIERPLSARTKRYRGTVKIARRRDYETIVVAPKRERVFGRIFDDDSQAFLVLGYGATRRVESPERFEPAALRKARRARYQRVAGLFEDQVALTPLGAWLPEVQRNRKARFREVVTMINQLLDGHAQMRNKLEGHEYLFEHRNALVPFAALSDGYRAFLGWIVDLLYHINSTCPTRTRIDQVPGVVLIDEIDLHLHPEWQRTLVPRIAQVFPRLQFILTSHSPLVAGALHAANIHVLEANAQGTVTPRTSDERIYGLNADQVLLGSYFNMKTTRAPAMADELVKLSRQARKGDDKAALRFMQLLAGARPAAKAESKTKRR